MKRLIVPVVIVVLLLVAGGSAAYAIYLGQRIASLEAELATRPRANVMLVVGKALKPSSDQTCVRYTISGGRVEETCIGNGAGYSGPGTLWRCFQDARIGEPLPPSCR